MEDGRKCFVWSVWQDVVYGQDGMDCQTLQMRQTGRDCQRALVWTLLESLLVYRQTLSYMKQIAVVAGYVFSISVERL